MLVGSPLVRSYTFHWEEVSQTVRTRSIAIRLIMQLKRKTSGLTACEPLRFLTLHYLRSLTQFLSPYSLS